MTKNWPPVFESKKEINAIAKKVFAPHVSMEKLLGLYIFPLIFLAPSILMPDRHLMFRYILHAALPEAEGSLAVAVHAYRSPFIAKCLVRLELSLRTCIMKTVTLQRRLTFSSIETFQKLTGQGTRFVETTRSTTRTALVRFVHQGTYMKRNSMFYLVYKSLCRSLYKQRIR